MIADLCRRVRGSARVRHIRPVIGRRGMIVLKRVASKPGWGPAPRLLAVLLPALLLLAACQTTPEKAIGSDGAAPTPTAATISVAPLAPLPGEPQARGKSAIVVDLDSGRTLYSEAADAPRYPASLTKMMTLYLLFEAVDQGRLTLDTPLPVSANAASRPPARLGLAAGSTIAVRDAIQALAVKSANDVAVVVAEALGGSEATFAQQMTQQARALGMNRTRFVNASGLPDPQQVTSARDMAVLARALKLRYPRYAHYFTARSFTYGGRRYEATNNLLGKVPGVDGLKTGYIALSGYNLAATARRGGRGLIVVVMGGTSERARDREVTALLERHFAASYASSEF